ncbi:hypothetical protein N7495_002174 [Penicillium taxi]|uniref:uncharacterized protein n=1 Tax=Penicillium taxi TaxID=168475 RepID=UPI0025456CF5|nr:uncharacterized protein N7495_002174 [Penicillium taxi]KAJ5901646.1 hypothetical protein N7495_002174 [Penicillium taxi]
MVKIDLRRNYYADLGLQIGADAEEIKKQFRKLALQLHPDRNPGKESEFIAKFQVIQSANEILSDPIQREKYDADRLRANYGKAPAPPKSSTPRNAPPKPQPARTPFTPRRPERPTDGHSTGSQRYSNWRPADSRQWSKEDNANTRADAWQGFSRMRNPSTGNTANTGASANGWQSFDPKTGRATPDRQHNKPFGQRPKSAYAENDENTRPRSAYERTKENGNTTRPAQGPNSHQKRQGFAPGVPGGDEPMARGTSNYTSSRPSSMYYDYSSAPPPTAKKSPYPDPQPDRFSRHSRSSPPNPKPKKQHKSDARPTQMHASDATSSSGIDSDDGSIPRNPKPKAVPVSRLGKKSAGVVPETGLHSNSKGAARDSTRWQQFSSNEPSVNFTPMKSETPGLSTGDPAGGTPIFQPASFRADLWAERLRNMTWSPEGSFANSGMRSPNRTSKPSTRSRTGPQPASVSTEAEEAAETVNNNIHPEPSRPTAEAEDMDVDMETPGSFKGSQSRTQHPFVPPPSAARMPPSSQGNSGESHRPPFNLSHLGNTAPFTATNNGGINNLGDIHTTLPFQSKAKQQRTTERDIRPRTLNLPNPPKRPTVPVPVSPHPGAATKVLDLKKWNFYVSAMGSYMHDWNLFNRRMVDHFTARQEANETGLSPNWISAFGDSLRLDIEGEDGDSKTDELLPGSYKGGFATYLRSIEEDILVRKHWEVAEEMHREAILDLGRLREWIRKGGNLV